MFQKQNKVSNQFVTKKDRGFLCVTGLFILLINVLTFKRQSSIWRQAVPGTEAGEIVYIYQHQEIYKWLLVIAASIGIILTITVLRKWTGKRKKITGFNKNFSGILWFMTPPLMFILMETITGNIATIRTIYIFKNLLIFYILYLVFSLCFKRQAVAAVVYCSVIMALTMAEYYVLLFRGRPFMIFDIWSVGTAAEVAGNYSYDIPAKVGCLLLVGLFIVVIEHYLQIMELPAKRWMVVVRLAGVSLFVGYMVLILKTDFLKRTGAEEMIIWNIQINNLQRGSLYSLYQECQYVCVEKPEGYSTDSVEKIVSDMGETVEDSEVTQPENLIVIMNESLADFERLGPVYADTELLPYIKSMDENTKKGWLQVPVIGGGTADTEYEVLTGNTKQFLPSGTSAYEFYCDEPEYGITETLKNQGYHTIAIHPANPGNWNRGTVYRDMGFDEFISQGNWGSDWETIRGFASDKSVYEKLIDIVDQKEEGEKLFTFAVTIQNHGGYEKEVEEEISHVSLDYEAEYPQAENYLTLVNESDRAFERLISHFEEVKEPTMIVMFGDHLPGFSDGFLDMLQEWGTTEGGMTEVEMYERLYQTPFVLWTNYDQDESSDEFMSTNYFGSYILQQAGLKLTPYNQFLLSIREEVPDIGMGAVCDKKGDWYFLDDLPTEYAEIIWKYKTLQYNNIMDRKHTCKEVFSLG
ncbi:MAG: LTA synthase family protein [Lachnospiraceae bacterium]|nr:LTA synthase family protein [Lachnospiraceae bacterium]